MAIAEELQILIDAKVTSAVRDLKKVDSQLGKTEKSARSMAKGFLKTGLAAAGVALSLGLIVKGLKSSVTAFGVQERAEASLGAAIIATGREMEISVDSMKEYASGLQQVTLFGDEAILSGQALLQSLANLNQEGLQKITPAVLDFATATGMNLEAAMSLVGKSIGSSTNALSRYGIEIDTSASESEKLAAITEELEAKFGGMAQAAGQTSSGALVQMQNATGDAQEAIGRLITVGLAPLARKLTEVATEYAETTNATALFKEEQIAAATGVGTLETRLAGLETQLVTLGEEARLTGGFLMLGPVGAEAAADREKALQMEIESLRRWAALQEEVTAGIENRDEERRVSALKTDKDLVQSAKGKAEEQIQALKGLEEAEISFISDGFANYQSYYAKLGILRMENVDAEREAAEEIAEADRENTLARISAIQDYGFALGEAITGEKTLAEACKEAAKSAAVTFLKSLGQKAAAQAAFNFASGNIGGGVAMATAAVGANVAAGAVSAFGAGGDFTTNGPQLIMVGDNPGGRERVRIDPQPDSRGGGSTQVVMNGDVYGAGGADEFIQGVIKGIKKAERGRVA